MSTTKHRINLSLPDDVKEAINHLALRDKVPAATKAAKLLEIGLELEEDQTWDKIATSRDNKKARFIEHDKAFHI